jgi:hypothetical protein
MYIAESIQGGVKLDNAGVNGGNVERRLSDGAQREKKRTRRLNRPPLRNIPSLPPSFAPPLSFAASEKERFSLPYNTNSRTPPKIQHRKVQWLTHWQRRLHPQALNLYLLRNFRNSLLNSILLFHTATRTHSALLLCSRMPA